MDSCISQSAYSGRATHRPRSSQPNRLTATWDNPVLDVGRCSIDSSRSLPQLLSQCFHFSLFIDNPSATQQAETVSRLLFLFGSWNLRGRRRKIILRLQLIFSPRFSSGKKTGLTLTAFCDINRVKSSPV